MSNPHEQRYHRLQSDLHEHYAHLYNALSVDAMLGKKQAVAIRYGNVARAHAALWGYHAALWGYHSVMAQPPTPVQLLSIPDFPSEQERQERLRQQSDRQ